MRVLLFGGSGRTGQLVTDELLTRGHEVTTLMRNPSSEKQKPGLRVVKGTPLNKEDVRAAFHEASPEVVIVTLSAPRAGDSPFAAVVSPPRLMADSNANIVAVMKETGVRKIVIMQAFGVGDSWSNMHCVLRLLMKKSNMIYQYDDHNLVDRETRAAGGVDYVMVRPSRLEEGAPKPVKEWRDAGKGVPMMAAISRGSVAKWLVDAAESSRWDNTCPVITN